MNSRADTCLWKVELIEDLLKDVAFGYAAGVAFVQGLEERGVFGFILFFFSLEMPQRRADNFAGVFVAAIFDLCGDEVVEFGSQVDVAGGHGTSPVTRIRRLAMIANRRIGTSRRLETG